MKTNTDNNWLIKFLREYGEQASSSIKWWAMGSGHIPFTPQGPFTEFHALVNTLLAEGQIKKRITNRRVYFSL